MRQFFQSENYQNTSKLRQYVYCPYCGAPLKTAGVRQYCEKCHFTPYYNPYPGVVVLVVKDGKVLLGKRAETSFRPSYWCLPGGFMEFDENFLAAAHREVQEETSLQVEIHAILNVVSNFLSRRLHTLVVVLLASPVSGEEKPGDDVIELGWFPLAGPLPALAFEADKYILQRYASGANDNLPVDVRFRYSSSTSELSDEE